MNKGLYGISKNRTYDTKYHILVESASYAVTASYIDPLYISASAAASGFGSGGTFDSSSFVTNAQTGSMSVATASYVFNSQNAINAETSSTPISSTQTTIYSTLPAAGPSINPNGVIALGFEAGQNTNFATYANYLGTSAGKGASSSNYSNFFGRFAGSSATNAQYSNFIGENAGANATNASGSNFFGYAAGASANSSSYSTFIGYRAGNSTPTSGKIKSNNIIIGTNITLPNNRQDSINIGGILFGTGSYFNVDEGVNPFSGSANGKIGINVVTPNYTLDVSGSGNFTNGLIVTGGITGSFSGSVAGYVSDDQTGSFILNSQTSSMTVLSSSFATTASYIEPAFISASAAASGFGSGGVTSITAGDGISVNQSTGNVIITNTGGSGGISQGKVVAIASGLANLF